MNSKLLVVNQQTPEPAVDSEREKPIIHQKTIKKKRQGVVLKSLSKPLKKKEEVEPVSAETKAG